MTQEEIQLLLKDLCARLPYGVKVKYIFDDGSHCPFELSTKILQECLDKGFLPYLRPMSSMTKEEFDEYMHFTKHSWEGIDKEEDDYYIKVKDRDVYFDWLLEHHFDYRGLIEKGLALEAPEGMYKNE